MPYELKMTVPEEQPLISSLESFWLYYDFEINPANMAVTTHNGYLGVYYSGDSDAINVVAPPYDLRCTLSFVKDKDENTMRLRLNHLALGESRYSEFSNEFSQLHVFKFFNTDDNSPPQPLDKTQWIDESSWKPRYTPPTKNRGTSQFIRRTFSLGGIEDRYLYWLMAKQDKEGFNSVAFATRLLEQSIFGQLLTVGNTKQNIPILKLSRKLPNDDEPKDWKYFDPNVGCGNIRGYVMIAEGAFKAIPLTGKIEGWLPQGGQTFSTQELVERLSQIVFDSTPFQRTLDTVDETEKGGFVVSDPPLPIELCFLTGLNDTFPNSEPFPWIQQVQA
jgi:hypothetical protein